VAVGDDGKHDGLRRVADSAEVFAHLKRAPNALAARVAEIPGVATVQAGLSVQVTLDLPGVDEPASGMVRSLP